MNPYMLVFLLLGGACLQAQPPDVDQVLGQWYLEHRFLATDADQDGLLSRSELEEVASDWGLFLHGPHFTEADHNEDQHLNQQEIRQYIPLEQRIRQQQETEEIERLGRQYPYFCEAKPKYLKRHPALAERVMGNAQWSLAHAELIGKLLRDGKWWRQHPRVLASLLSNFRFLLEHSALAQHVYDKPWAQQASPTPLLSWQQAHLQLLAEFPFLLQAPRVALALPNAAEPAMTAFSSSPPMEAQESVVPITPAPSGRPASLPPHLPATPTAPSEPTPSEPTPSERKLREAARPALSMPGSLQTVMNEVDQQQRLLQQRLARVKQGPDPIKTLRDSATIVIGVQKQEIRQLYQKLNEQTRFFARLRQRELDSLSQINDSLDRNLWRTELQLNSLSRERSALTERLRTEEQRNQRLWHQLRALRIRQDSLQGEVAHRNQQVAALTDELYELATRYKDFAQNSLQQIDSVKRIEQGLRGRIQRDQMSMRSQQRELAAMRSRLRQAQDEWDSSQALVSLVLWQRDSLAEQLERTTLGLARHQDSLQSLRQRYQRAQALLLRSQQGIDSLQAQANLRLQRQARRQDSLQQLTQQQVARMQELQQAYEALQLRDRTAVAERSELARLRLENDRMREQIDASQEFVRLTLAEKNKLETRLGQQERSIAELRNQLASPTPVQTPPTVLQPLRDSIRGLQMEVVELEQQVGMGLRAQLDQRKLAEQLKEEVASLQRQNQQLAGNRQVNELRFRQLENREQQLNQRATKNKEREQLLIQRERILNQKIAELEVKERKYRRLAEKEKELKLLEQRLKQQLKDNP